jgi:uncharacterized YigZ family protein
MLPPSDSYHTLSAPVSTELKILSSRFIAACAPADTTEAVQEFLEKVRKEYPDATHHCYAYRIGIDGRLFRTVDDGEPSGTAGKPILSAIDKRGLTNVLAVVTRYFGGTKLGVGGLTRAYAQAAGEALAKGEAVERFVEEQMEVAFPHPRTSVVMRVASRTGARILSTAYDEGVRLILAIRVSRRKELVDSLINETGGQAVVTGPLPPSELPPS